MSEVRKILGQINLAATTLTAIYTVPGSTSTVVSTIIVCNTSGVAATFRVSCAVNGAADAISQYIYYEVPIPASETFASTIGITLGAGDVIRGYSTAGNLTVSLFGVEVA